MSHLVSLCPLSNFECFLIILSPVTQRDLKRLPVELHRTKKNKVGQTLRKKNASFRKNEFLKFVFKMHLKLI